MKKSVENIVRHSEVSEKAIEAYLSKRVKEANLLCLKYSNANTTGYPDRMICLPYGLIIWVELKSKGRKPTKLQMIRHDELRRLGHRVFVIDSKEQVDRLMDFIEKRQKLSDLVRNYELDTLNLREYLNTQEIKIERQAL